MSTKPKNAKTQAATSQFSFYEVRFQYHDLIMSDRNLRSTTKNVGASLLTTYHSKKTGTARVSHEQIASRLKLSVKSVQRAVKQLKNEGWFLVQSGRGPGYCSEFRPCQSKYAMACSLRAKGKKASNLAAGIGEKNDDKKWTGLSQNGGQPCPPNPNNNKYYYPNTRAKPPTGSVSSPAWQMIFVPADENEKIETWGQWFEKVGLPKFGICCPEKIRKGMVGYYLPSLYAPDVSSELSRQFEADFRRRLKL